MAYETSDEVKILTDELQSIMATIFDSQYTQVSDVISKAYYTGLEHGKLVAKTEIINMIKGEPR